MISADRLGEIATLPSQRDNANSGDPGENYRVGRLMAEAIRELLAERTSTLLQIEQFKASESDLLTKNFDLKTEGTRQANRAHLAELQIHNVMGSIQEALLAAATMPAGDIKTLDKIVGILLNADGVVAKPEKPNNVATTEGRGCQLHGVEGCGDCADKPKCEPDPNCNHEFVNQPLRGGRFCLHCNGQKVVVEKQNGETCKEGILTSCGKPAPCDEHTYPGNRKDEPTSCCQPHTPGMSCCCGCHSR